MHPLQEVFDRFDLILIDRLFRESFENAKEIISIKVGFTKQLQANRILRNRKTNDYERLCDSTSKCVRESFSSILHQLKRIPTVPVKRHKAKPMSCDCMPAKLAFLYVVNFS